MDILGKLTLNAFSHLEEADSERVFQDMGFLGSIPGESNSELRESHFANYSFELFYVSLDQPMHSATGVWASPKPSRPLIKPVASGSIADKFVWVSSRI